MKTEEHEETSLIMFGQRYTQIHIFLDQYFPKFRPYHRIVLHHQKGIDLVDKEFSGPARAVAEQHIMEDQGSIPDDWREGFDFDLDYVDAWFARKTRLPENSMKGVLRKLYPEMAKFL